MELPVEDRKGLIQLVTGLPVDVFTASDSLGWCYQFWQAERKEQVNAAGNKIGADELPSVTQLFTEDYMVDFLLDNTLGAWHAGKKLTTVNADGTDFETEQDCRNSVALPGCEWKYLRFIREPTALTAGSDDESSDGDAPEASANGSGAWRPAAGRPYSSTIPVVGCPESVAEFRDERCSALIFAVRLRSFSRQALLPPAS